MGVPGLFRIIVEKYKDSYLSSNNLDNIDNFFIDFNAMIYNAYNLFDKDLAKKYKLWQIEEIIIDEVIKYTKYLITDVVKPKKMVYISFDGSAPISKMVQQRCRRQKSILEEGYIKYLKKKYNIEDKNIKFDKCSISPGTNFMFRLSKKLQKHIKEKYFNEGLNLEKIILSDSNVPGEGEHKFMPELKNLNKDDINAIYSPDADMIVLSILSNQNNIYILKKYSDFKDIVKLNIDDPPNFIYLNIDFCKEKFLDSLVQDYEGELENAQNFLKDWVFLTILSGNDFVIPLPFLKINKNNMKLMPQLTQYYKIIYKDLNKNLIDENLNIDIDFLRDLVHKISCVEHSHYKKILKNIHRVRKEGNQRADNNEDGLSEYDIDLNRFYHREFYDEKNPLFKIYNKEFDKINYFEDDWESKYYTYYFGNNSEDFKKIICEEYIQILLWNFKYYINSIPPSWSHYYRDGMPPLFKDLYNYLKNIKEIKINFIEDLPIEPLKQLMLILPKKSCNMLPQVLKNNLLKEDDFYKERISLDVLNGQKYIYSDPILDDFKYEIIDNIYNQNKKKLSKEEYLRNKLNIPFVFKMK